MKNIGKIIIINAINIAVKENKINDLKKIVEPFLDDPLEIDMLTLAKMEALIGEKLLIINPTLKEIRKSKLEKLKYTDKYIEQLYKEKIKLLSN